MSRLERSRWLNDRNLITPDELKEHFAHGESDEFNQKIKTYINDVVFLRERYLFVKKIGKEVHAQCSYCGQRSTFKRVPKQKSKHICIDCESELTARNTSFHNYKDISYYEFIHFEKSSLSDDILVAYQFATQRTISGALDEINDVLIEDGFRAIAYYYFDKGSKNRLFVDGYYSYQHEPRFKQSMHIVNSNQHYFWGISSESLEVAIKDTDFKYSAAEDCAVGYRQLNIVKYLALYCKYPQIEKLIKVGFKDLIVSYLCGSPTYSSVNWRATTIEGMLKLNKSEIAFFRSQNTYGFQVLKTIQALKSKGFNTSEHWVDANRLEQYTRSVSELAEVISADKPSRVIRYLEGQVKKHPTNYKYVREAYLDFYDLIKDMKILKMEINKKTLYYKDLKRHHMNISGQVKVHVNEIYDKAIEKRLPKLIEYQWENDEFIISPAKSSNQLIVEGEALKHCVGGYAERYKSGQTNIFLLRRISEVDEPFFTIEIDKEFKRVVQCHGKGHSRIENHKDAAIFFNEYQKLFLNKKASPQDERIAN